MHLYSVGQRMDGRLGYCYLGNGTIVEQIKDGVNREAPLYRFRPDDGDGGSYPLYEHELRAL